MPTDPEHHDGHHHDERNDHRHDAEVVMDGAFWDRRYESGPALWSREPNRHLVTEAERLAPGRALDVGCGEGADAIWLATRGWQVTGVDISQVALDRAAARASETAEIADRITWLHADVIEWVPDSDAYGLVSAQFLHLPSASRDPLYRRLADAVAPGGTLLIVGHHISDLETNVGRPPVPDLFFSTSDVAASLGESWTVVVNEARARQAVDRDGHPTTVHDAVLRAQRG
jgi:SAM-dependent methyltransferase